MTDELVQVPQFVIDALRVNATANESTRRCIEVARDALERLGSPLPLAPPGWPS